MPKKICKYHTKLQSAANTARNRVRKQDLKTGQQPRPSLTTHQKNKRITSEQKEHNRKTMTTPEQSIHRPETVASFFFPERESEQSNCLEKNHYIYIYIYIKYESFNTSSIFAFIYTCFFAKYFLSKFLRK